MRSSNEWGCAGERTHSWDDETPDPDWLKEIEYRERISMEELRRQLDYDPNKGHEPDEPYYRLLET